MSLVLGNHIRQTEALCHGFRRVHVGGRGQVSTRVTRSAIVVQFCTFRGWKSGFLVKAVTAFNMLSLLQKASAKTLNDKRRGARTAIVQDGEGIKAQFSKTRAGRHDWWPFIWKQTPAFPELGLCLGPAYGCCWGQAWLGGKPKLRKQRLDRNLITQLRMKDVTRSTERRDGRNHERFKESFEAAATLRLFAATASNCGLLSTCHGGIVVNRPFSSEWHLLRSAAPAVYGCAVAALHCRGGVGSTFQEVCHADL